MNKLTTEERERRRDSNIVIGGLLAVVAITALAILMQ